MKSRSLSAIIGRDKDKKEMYPSLSSASSIIFPNYDALEKATLNNTEYGRANGKNSIALRNALSLLECSDKYIQSNNNINQLLASCPYDTLIFPSGAFACIFTIISMINRGEHIIISSSVYKKSSLFIIEESEKYGFTYDFFDQTNIKQLNDLVIEKKPSIIYFETPGSDILDIADIEEIVKIAKENNIYTIADNSWATPLFLKHLEYGIDVVVYSASKYPAGHSDLIMGIMSSKKGDLYNKIRKKYYTYCVHISEHDCHMVYRGLRTMYIRIVESGKSAIKVANFLLQHNLIKDVLHPALPSFKGYDIWQKYCKEDIGGCFSFKLNKKYPYEKLKEMINNMKFFAIGIGWGGYCSMIKICNITNFDIEESVIRIYCGLENPDDLIDDLKQGLKILS